MKRRIDLEKATEGEKFGALAVRSGAMGEKDVEKGRFTPAQSRALSGLARSLMKAAPEAGAEHSRISVGDVSLELKESGREEILSIRTIGS